MLAGLRDGLAVASAPALQDLLATVPVRRAALPEGVVIEAPRYSVEMLRNDDGIQLIGLLPAGTDPKDFVAEAEALDYLAKVEAEMGLPATDPFRFGAAKLVDALAAM